MKPIAYYITAHGYGHGTRSCDVLRALYRLYPEQPVIVTTDLPRDFLNSRLKDCTNITFRCGAFDVGLIQKDSLQSDLSRTLEKLEALYAREEELIEQEQCFIAKNDVAAVAADIPAIPLAAAQRAGIPNIAIGNFSWDWIYEAYVPQNPRWEFFAGKFRSVYEKTDLLLRLPFAPPMEQFRNRKDIPLLASPGMSRKREILNSKPEARNKSKKSDSAFENSKIVSDFGIRASDIPPKADKPWVLLSFTSLDLSFQALENIRTMSGAYEFFCVQPMTFPGSCIRSVDRHQVCFADILASCDIVISKPGFGLVSECIVNRKPLIYADRGDFAEYPYLVEGIEKYLRNVHIPSAQLYAGEFSQALEKIKSAPDPGEHLAAGGAEMIAQMLIHSGES
jgi:L-arabinokinase